MEDAESDRTTDIPDFFHYPFNDSSEELRKLKSTVLSGVEIRNIKLRTLNPDGPNSDAIPPVSTNSFQGGRTSLGGAIYDICLRSCRPNYGACKYCLSGRPIVVKNASRKRSHSNRDRDVSMLAGVSVPSLRVLAMQKVLQHCRRPSQFEAKLPRSLAQEVWNHLPARFLITQRVLRSYALCGCPRELWLWDDRIIRQRITMCARCLNVNKDRSSSVRCYWCEKEYGYCGCLYMPHINITMWYNGAGCMRKIFLGANRVDWENLGSATTIGDGYLHGRIDWSIPPIALHPTSPVTTLEGVDIPPSVAFHAGIRIDDAKSLHVAKTGAGSALRLCIVWPAQDMRRCTTKALRTMKSRSAGLMGMDRDANGLVSFALERKMDRLVYRMANNRTLPHLRTGASIWQMVDRWNRESRTLAIFKIAAATYMRTIIHVHTKVEKPWSVIQGPQQDTHYPAYCKNIGVDYPKAEFDDEFLVFD